MRNVRRHVVIDDLRLRHGVEVSFRIVVFVDLVDVGDVKRAVVERDAAGHPEPLADDGLDGPFAAFVDDGVNLAVSAEQRPDEQRALVAPRHLPRIGHAARPQLDLEAGRQLDLLQFGFDLVFGEAGRRRQGFQIVGTLELLGFVSHEPVVRRM